MAVTPEINSFSPVYMHQRAHRPSAQTSSFGFHSDWLPQDAIPDIPIQMHQLVDEAKYQTICQRFEYLCGDVSSPVFKPFTSICFPTLDVFNYLITLYFRNINRVITVFHFPTLALHSSHWIVALALAAEGSQYLEGEATVGYAVSMREFLRRALIVVAESDQEGASSTELAQAGVLHLIGMTYSHEKGLVANAGYFEDGLVGFCLRDWRSSLIEVEVSKDTDMNSIPCAWRRWIDMETKRRVGYLIWMVDCMLASQLDRTPLLTLRDAIIPLPYPEVLWETSSALQWYELLLYQEPIPSLESVIQTLYIEGTLKKALGEFSHILVIHGLYHRIWEVERYLDPGLFSPLEQPDADDFWSVASWEPPVLDQDKWRETTYQCLGLLRLAAKRVISAASGVEHPTVCHLHLATITLFAPIGPIRQFVNGLVYGTTSENQLSGLRDDIRKWVTEDQRSSRLAVVYAGVQFWHLRKFSASAFYEPHAVLVSTLVLWAFGTFNQRTTNDKTVPEPTFSEDGVAMPIAINVDRPTDDELIQLFIHDGNNLLALMSGVGDICGTEGPSRILLEGAKMIGTLDKWGCSKEAAQILRLLIDTGIN